MTSSVCNNHQSGRPVALHLLVSLSLSFCLLTQKFRTFSSRFLGSTGHQYVPREKILMTRIFCTAVSCAPRVVQNTHGITVSIFTPLPTKRSTRPGEDGLHFLCIYVCYFMCYFRVPLSFGDHVGLLGCPRGGS